MAYTTIDNPELYFQTKLFTGNGGTQSITLDGSENMQPDWCWFKNRTDAGNNHLLYDSVRGATKRIQSSTTSAEATDSDGLTSFDSDGFSIGSKGSLNASSSNIVSWNWKAGGSASSNSDGSITSSVSAGITQGMSIVSYTGNGTTNATVGHGLGVTPNVIWFKRRDSSNNWINYFSELGTGHYLTLNTNGAKDSASGAWCTPGSSTFQLNQVFSAMNTNTATYIAYCFAEKKGYSKFGKYRGNSSSDGVYLNLGFKASCIMLKSDASEHWEILDNKRSNSFNAVDGVIFPSLSNAEETTNDICDFLSSGVKFRHSDGRHNSSSHDTYFMAFAESPFVNSNGVPNNAR